MTTTNPSVLIIDDDPDNLLTPARFFKEWGWHVETAVNLKDAVTATKMIAFDLVTLDLMMSPDSGREVLAALRASGCKSHVVVLTGLYPHEAARAVHGMDIEGVFNKSEIPTRLYDYVVGLLEERQ